VHIFAYIHPLTEKTCLAFPAEAGTHLPTPEGWKAELALGGWLVTYRNKCLAPGIKPVQVAHLSTNRARPWTSTLRHFNEFGKPAFQLITASSSIELFDQKSASITHRAVKLVCVTKFTHSRVEWISALFIFNLSFKFRFTVVMISCCDAWLPVYSKHRDEDLLVIKGRSPLTHHIRSITINTKNAQAIKTNKLTMNIIHV